jgi:acyl-CoA synthetase (NDP forming)/GNAT superfamily N-acetyltransferase
VIAPNRPAARQASAGSGTAAADLDTGASSYALLTDGSTVEIRAAGPQDVAAVREMHAAMSPDNIYLRFFSLSPRLGEREAMRVCREPGADHAALLAWLGGRLVGVASYEPTGTAGTAEIAFAVPDDMHRRGVATLLLEHLVSLARRHGLSAFTAQTLLDNSAMLRVFADAGLPTQRRIVDGVAELTFPLPGGGADHSLDSYLQSVGSRESRADVASLRYLLQPGSVAVVGASRERPTVARAILHNIVAGASREHPTVGRAILHNIVAGGFAGRIYAVNPHARHVEGVPCVASVDALPEPVDLAIIAVPAAAVPAVAAACGDKGVRALTVITSGLGTAGADLLAICRRHGMRLVGPNCLGVEVPAIGLNATFAAQQAAPGVAGLVVQSGGVGIALLDQLSRLGIGVSSFASVGDKYDVSSNDMLMWWEQDGLTRLAVLYVESFGSPRKFARTARRVGQRMPVLTVVGGRSEAGQSAAASHTAAAATPLITREALFGQAGIIAASSLGELVEAAALLACQPLPAGNRVAIVTNAGGAGVLAADACGDHGLKVVKLSGATSRRLRGLLPAAADVAGPVDTTAGVSADTFRACLEQAAADDGVDAVIAVTVPTALADLRSAITGAAISKPIAVALLEQPEAVRLLQRDHDAHATEAPAVEGPGAGTVPDAGSPGPPAGQAAELPAVAGLPAYAYPESAARALGHAARYRAWRDRQSSRVPELGALRAGAARQLIAGFLASSPGGGWLPAALATELLSCYQIPVVATLPAAGEQEAIAAAARLGGPVVLKAEAPDLVHKSEAGAVKLDLRTEQDVAEGYRQLAAEFGSRLSRVLVQPMLTGGIEVLIGVVQEPVFGPLVVFGLGGVTTDILGDYAARLTPLTQADAHDLIRELRAAPLLFGHRGTQPADTGALAEVLLRVSRLADDLPEIAELDLNPIVASPGGACAVDVRVRVAPAEARDPFLRRLR